MRYKDPPGGKVKSVFFHTHTSGISTSHHGLTSRLNYRLKNEWALQPDDETVTDDHSFYFMDTEGNFGVFIVINNAPNRIWLTMKNIIQEFSGVN